eukprot:14468771-Ditylum_brightwellii.AAC.1
MMATQWRKEILQELPKLLLMLHNKPAGQRKLTMEALFDGLFHQEWTRRQDMHVWGGKFVDIKEQRRNKLAHGSMEQCHQQLKFDRYKSTIETMFHYKDRLHAEDRQYMFQNLTEVGEFLQTKSVQYIQDWITIWYPFFKKGIKDGQKQATAGVKPITSYFNKKSTTSRAKLLRRFTSHYNNIKRDAKQKQGAQTRGRACIDFKDHRGVENT